MRFRTLALSLAFCVPLAAPASAQVVTGGAGNTGISPPPSVGGVSRSGRDHGPAPISRGHEADFSNLSVPGTTPDMTIGRTPTSGPPGSGGTAGGPALDR